MRSRRRRPIRSPSVPIVTRQPGEEEAVDVGDPEELRARWARDRRSARAPPGRARSGPSSRGGRGGRSPRGRSTPAAPLRLCRLRGHVASTRERSRRYTGDRGPVRIRPVTCGDAAAINQSWRTSPGVTTTGIYCRPGCGGPTARNVTRYPLAAAAEAAGFRACFQCRPYRWPQSVLDRPRARLPRRQPGPRRRARPGEPRMTSECASASRGGISGGSSTRTRRDAGRAGPLGRAQFARRLLDDTDLPCSRSPAAGSAAFASSTAPAAEIFRRSPRELRAKRRKADRLVADGSLGLPALPGPARLVGDCSRTSRRAIPGVEHVSGAHVPGTIVVDGDPASWSSPPAPATISSSSLTFRTGSG